MVLCYKVAREHWHHGRILKSFEWGCPCINSKESVNYPCFNFFIACDFMQFHFPLLHGSVCVKGSYRAITESSKLHLSNAGEPPFLKTRSRKWQIRMMVVIVTTGLKRTKWETPIKFFFVLSLRATMMLSLQMVQFHAHISYSEASLSLVNNWRRTLWWCSRF